MKKRFYLRQPQLSNIEMRSFKPLIVSFPLWFGLLIISGYYFHQQMLDHQSIHLYLKKNGLDDLPVSRESAITVSKQIRRDFNTDVSTFEVLDYNNRPFLRHDSRFLLTHKEGECGQGTRVLVNLLAELGFDATRVTLFDKYLNPSHTLVSVEIDGESFLVDSINTRKWFNDFLNENSFSIGNFSIAQYSDSIESRSHLVEKLRLMKPSGEAESRIHQRFWVYSFDAIPLTKLLSKLGFRVQFFNLQRPIKQLSFLAERPNATMCFVTFGMGFSLFLVMSWWSLVRALRNKRADSVEVDDAVSEKESC